MTGPEVRARWSLVADGTAWRFGPQGDGPVVAAFHASAEQAWRGLTNNLGSSAGRAVHTAGDPAIIETLERTRAIIGVPK